MKSGFVLAASLRGAIALLSPRGPDAAGQIRLAYHGADGMTVSWNTFEHVKAPSVKWGLSKGKLEHTASSNVSLTYPTSTTYNNHVVISGLKPDTTYYYLPSPLPQGNHVEPYTFRTARAAGDSDAFAVAVVVDLGTMGRLGLTTSAGSSVSQNNILKPGEKNTIDSLASTKSSYDFIWHPGDIAYADYWLKLEIQGVLPNTTIQDGHTVYEAILNDFYDEMAAVTETKPYMVGPGNHEANCDNGGTTDKAKNITYDVSICSPGQTNFTGFKNHFRMPSDVSGGTGNFWYSWDNGMVHFIQLDTETDLGHGFTGPDEIGGTEKEGASPVNATMNAQATWLEADLASVDRKKTPWVVVAGHRPWYLSKKNVTGTICWSCKDVFEPLFIQYNVDLVLTGHAHVYERLAPLANGTIDPNELNNPKAPWYITNGAGGHYDGLDSFDEPKQKYSRFGLDTANATYGWSRLTFHNCSHLTHEFIASNNNSALDTATLFKDRSCGPCHGNGNGNGNGGGGAHHSGAAGSATREPTRPTKVANWNS
ncbi:purple acid phosphatase [Metarhizium robertsii]|uniref:Purple acid phosphatase n=2 Tax=Metarhizium robertsii TaxID=568076 RepID=E9ENB8_METRA|nr:metallophosphoesterase [Metarhizium robertsii ARSEF 23]EFZ04130.1 metallophosphoesterase [Metarhizium robertsii ARSEF 23]EXV00891.1 purple acid phosphatase [Metarhizium robertsii]